MSCRLHVANKYDVDYQKSPEYFNYDITEFHDLMTSLNVNEIRVENEFVQEFDIEREEFKKGIERLKHFDKIEEFDEECDKAEIDYCIIKLMGGDNEEHIGDLIKYLENLDKASDPNNSFIHFCFF